MTKSTVLPAKMVEFQWGLPACRSSLTYPIIEGASEKKLGRIRSVVILSESVSLRLRKRDFRRETRFARKAECREDLRRLKIKKM